MLLLDAQLAAAQLLEEPPQSADVSEQPTPAARLRRDSPSLREPPPVAAPARPQDRPLLNRSPLVPPTSTSASAAASGAQQQYAPLRAATPLQQQQQLLQQQLQQQRPPSRPSAGSLRQTPVPTAMTSTASAVRPTQLALGGAEPPAPVVSVGGARRPSSSSQNVLQRPASQALLRSGRSSTVPQTVDDLMQRLAEQEGAKRMLTENLQLLQDKVGAGCSRFL